ncbi:hypothetical protein Taro_051223 [Colocasia esculenta]|uniref:Uncharacterized protein n=1 Tax=Colocasia esculenta TaxID=4460 RepID=A0A843XFZ2_COLES|nr:hypothetical protein [Colocasia esculenta]
MASRGRRGGASAPEDEPRRDERAEQQAPAPPGPVLPPPPPVDYGVFMQGLVQAMQTQAHTQVALQAQLEAQKNLKICMRNPKPEINMWLRVQVIWTSVVGDVTPLEETVETGSERGD